MRFFSLCLLLVLLVVVVLVPHAEGQAFPLTYSTEGFFSQLTTTIGGTTPRTTPFSVRHSMTFWSEGHSIFVFGGSPYLGAPNGFFTDIWKSDDRGVTWVFIGTGPSVTGAIAVTWQGRHYIFHGRSSGVDTTLIFFAPLVFTTPSTWTSFTAPYRARSFHGVVTFAPPITIAFTAVTVVDVILVFGGQSGTTLLNDVWMYYTPFGQTNSVWLQQPTAPWTSRSSFGFVTIEQETIIVIGGGGGQTFALNDVWQGGWSDTTGFINWWPMTLSAPWSTRLPTFTASLNNYIYMSGAANYLSPFGWNSDLWVSPDGGANWVVLTFTESFGERVAAAIFILERRLLFIGGFNGNAGALMNDVWQGWAPF